MARRAIHGPARAWLVAQVRVTRICGIHDNDDMRRCGVAGRVGPSLPLLAVVRARPMPSRALKCYVFFLGGGETLRSGRWSLLLAWTWALELAHQAAALWW